IQSQDRENDDDHDIAKRGSVSKFTVTECPLVGKKHGEQRAAAGATVGENENESERVEVPDEVERGDGEGHRSDGGPCDRCEPPPRSRTVEGGGLVEFGGGSLKCREQRQRWLRDPRPLSHDDDGRQCQLEAAKPVDAVCDETERVQHSVEDSSIGMINKFPQKGSKSRRPAPRHGGEGPCQPLEFEPRVEQQRKPQCEKELDGGDRERPDQPNLESAPEQIVLEHLDVV